MARRIVRTIIQLCCLAAIIFIAVFVLDLRFKVLPQTIHNHLPTTHWHHKGHVITDITYRACSRVFFSSCSVEDNWIRINKDVNLGGSILGPQGYIEIKRQKEEDFDAEKGDMVVLDVKVGRLDPSKNSLDGTRWERRPGGIWLKRGKKLVDDGVTGVDLLFGADAVEVRSGWEIKGTLTEGQEARLTVQKGQAIEHNVPKLRINEHKKFTIIQLTDLHLSTGTGKCRDPEPPETAAFCEADPRTLEYIEKILDVEKPDFAVLSGDMVNGETAPDAQTAIFKALDILIKRKIPYSAIFGNHDDEGNLSRTELMDIIERLPYSVSQAGPPIGELITDRKGRTRPEGGVGNYVVEVYGHSAHSDKSAITIYFFDTHSYSPDEKQYRGYDWVKQSQIDWFVEEKQKLETKHAKSQYPYMHLEMAFIHIPLPEYGNQTEYRFGSWDEPITAPHYNSGLAKALINHGVTIVAAGHDHVNDYCLLHKPDYAPHGGMWLCYGGGGGFGGYGGYKHYQRRVRLYEVDVQSRTVTTWTRLERGEEGRFELYTLIGPGEEVKQ